VRKAAAFGLLVAFLAAAPALAQQTEDAVLRIDDVDQSDFPTVVLTLTVPAALNGLDLVPENFFVSEDGRSVDIEVFQLPPSELQVALLIDTSGSMRGSPITAARNAVSGFVNAMPEDVELALLRFGDTSEELVPFTTDQDQILAGINRLSPGGETALYDGLLAAVDSFEESEGRRTIVLLTDGGDTASKATLEDALVGLIGSDARLLIVELESPEADRTTLTRLQATTAGTLVAATDPDGLEAIYAEAASDLINQYELTFGSFAQGSTELVAAVRTTDVAAVGSITANFPIPVTTTAAVGPVETTTTTTTVAPVVVAAVPIDINIPWFASTSGLMVGAASIFVATALVLLLLMPTRRGALSALGSLAGLAGRGPNRSRFSELTNKATLFAEDRLNRGKDDGGLRLRLDQAGLRLREGEFALLVSAVGLVGVVAGLLFGGVLVAIAVGIAVVLAAFGIINFLATRRATKFRMQLPDTLQLISGSLRAGFGLNQAITAVAEEQDSPASEEFARAQLEVHLGRDVGDALRTMAGRTQSEDLPWVAEAIEIHREIGGDIADLLDQIASTVRERERVRGQIQVLSAEGKVSGIVLVALPLVIAGITFSVAPDYLSELTGTTPGQIMLASGAGSMIIGIFWIRRIVRLEF